MSGDTWRSFLRAVPKCEHHMHIEGALSPQLLFQLAAKNGIALPADDPAYASMEALTERYARFVSLDDFLLYYYIGMSVLVTKDDFAALAWDYFEHAAADGVVHAELFFDPQAHLVRGVDYDTVLSGIEKSRQRAESELGITSELICCFLRHLPPTDCEAAFSLPALQASIARGSIKAIGLDSNEVNRPPQLFTKLYRDAASLNLNLTAHAGEAGPAAYVLSALDDLAVTRIDHGIRAADDPALLARLAASKTLMTLCPISNVFLRSAPSIAGLPVREFLKAGVRFSINSDDPAYFGGHYILDNYLAVHDAFSLSVTDWKFIVEAGIQGSWCSEERKTQMLHRLERVLEEWSTAGKLTLKSNATGILAN